MDRLEDFRYTMESCNHCGQCKWIAGAMTRGWHYAEVCPIHMRFHFDAYSGQGLINIAQELLDRDLDYEPGLIDLIYSCTMCGACDINCKSIRDMEPLDTIAALRARCVEDGQGPLPAHRRMAESVAQHHNVFGRAHPQRDAWVTPDMRFAEHSSTAYFVGCAASYLHTDIARNTVKILNAGGMEFKLLHADEYCCGRPLWQTGQWDAAARQVEHNLAALKRHGITTIITSCAECFGAFRGIYPRFAAMDIAIIHTAEVVADMLKDGRLQPTRNVDLQVTYHDPCLLGRLSEPYVPWQGEIKSFGLHEPPKQWRRGHDGVYAAPREVLDRIPGIERTEMVRHAENALCCGAGGGVGAAKPELARWTANERLGEARSTGAGTLVSCCPYCRSNFEGALREHPDGLEYLDLTEIIARAL